MNKALVILGVLGIIGGIGVFVYGSNMAGQMTFLERLANPGQYHQDQMIEDVGIAVSIIGFLLIAVGAVLKGNKVPRKPL